MTRRVTSPETVGRTGESAALTSAWEDVLGGSPRTVLVAGEPGIGKTRLVDDLVARVRASGGLVAAGSCPRLGSSVLPFAPFRQVLADLAGALGSERLTALAGSGARALPVLVPELAEAGTSSGTAGQADLLEVVARLVQRVCQDRVLAVVIEDLHWSDPSTRDLVGYLAPGGRGNRLLLVGTLRSEPPPAAPVDDLVDELGRLPGTERLDLGPLTPAGVAQMMAGILGSPPDSGQADRVAARSQGVPFLVEELTAAEAAGDQTLPAGLRQLALRRTRSASAAATGVLRALAAAGRPVRETDLGQVCEVTEVDMAATLRELVDAGHVVVDLPAGLVDVRHVLLREAVEDDLLPGESAALHGRWADLLESADGDRRAVIEAAHHRWLAGDHERAFPATLRAAAAARSLSAYGEELVLLERALALRDPAASDDRPDEARLLADAGQAARLAGQYPRAWQLLEQARSALAADEVDSLARVLWEESLLARSLGEVPGVEDAIGSLLAGPAGAHPQARAHALNALLQLQLHRDDPLVRDTLRTAVAASEQAGELLLGAHLRVTDATLLADSERAEDALAELDRAAAVVTSTGDLPLELRVHEARARALLAAGRDLESEQVARAGIDCAARRGSPVLMRDYLVAALVDALAWSGRWTQALAVLDDTLLVDRPDLERAGLLARRARLMLATGTPGAAAAVAAARTRLAGVRAAADLHVLVAVAEAELALSAGLPTDALEIAHRTYVGYGGQAGPAVLRPLLLAAAVAARPTGPADRRGGIDPGWVRSAAATLAEEHPREAWDTLLAAELAGAGDHWQRALAVVGRAGAPARLRLQVLLDAAAARLSRPPGQRWGPVRRGDPRRRAARPGPRARRGALGAGRSRPRPQGPAGPARAGHPGRSGRRASGTSHGARARGAGSAGPGQVQRPDRRGARHQRQDGERARVARARQARGLQPRRGRGRRPGARPVLRSPVRRR